MWFIAVSPGLCHKPTSVIWITLIAAMPSSNLTHTFCLNILSSEQHLKIVEDQTFEEKVLNRLFNIVAVCWKVEGVLNQNSEPTQMLSKGWGTFELEFESLYSRAREMWKCFFSLSFSVLFWIFFSVETVIAIHHGAVVCEVKWEPWISM